MEIKFIETSPSEVKDFFPFFYSDNKVFFEIMKDDKPIGFYGIKDVGNHIGEISLYVNENSRGQLTKRITHKMLKLPFELGFRKIFISTDVKSVERFLRTLEKLGKLGVKYLFENEKLHWFEVNYGVC